MPTRIPSPFQFGHWGTPVLHAQLRGYGWGGCAGFGQEPTPNGEYIIETTHDSDPSLLAPWEWVAVAMGVVGGFMILAPDVFSANERWARYGGAALTLGGIITGLRTLQAHREAQARARAGT